MSISICFLVTGLMMLKTIQDHYEQFYKDYGTWIWISTFALSIPMFFRSLNLFLMSANWYYDLYLTHYTLMISIYVFGYNVFPFFMQMTTLIFGALKLYSKKHKEEESTEENVLKRPKLSSESGLNDNSSSDSDESDYS